MTDGVIGRYSDPMRRVLFRVVLALVAVIGLFWLAGSTVTGSDMMPSIQPGDRVWSLPADRVVPGDVVTLADPMDPDSIILRRVLAVGGQTIEFKEHTIRVGNRRLRSSAMGDMEDFVVTRETLWAKKPAVGHSWLTRFPSEPATLWSADPVDVPEGHVYLLGDDRDRVVDSRWWGPIPLAAIKQTVRLRWGEAHVWRENWEWMVGTPPIGD